jgi:8-oxo-dGTP pyrophosphatase MutT (NUDIX family)
MKYLRDATYVVGGYVVRDSRVLLLWHGGLARWVPTGGRIELASGEYPHEALIREVREETGLAVRVPGGAGLEVRDDAATPLTASFPSITARPAPTTGSARTISGGSRCCRTFSPMPRARWTNFRPPGSATTCRRRP